MKYWKKLTFDQINERISQAVAENRSYGQNDNPPLGLPASKLDPEVFNDNATFLSDAPILRTFVANPNHIGCHTQDKSEDFFSGTQSLEREVIEILAVDCLHASPQSIDGYIASGGTEANLQAVWMYRNYYKKEYGATLDEIAIFCSEDTHYSVYKAKNLLSIDLYKVSVDYSTRKVSADALNQTLNQAIANGIKYFIVICNMGTTMFGSVDNPDEYVEILESKDIKYRIHIDGAFGGFIYPTSNQEHNLGFNNPHIYSYTLDAHKMLQAPYGTGIFLTKKGMINYVQTKEAQYVIGTDNTLIGSRSGANALAVWMILHTYGPYGWLEKINKLLYRTEWLCNELKKLNVTFFHQDRMNIVSIPAKFISEALAKKYVLVPDTHSGAPSWFKIIVMDHVTIENLQSFITSLKETLSQK